MKSLLVLSGFVVAAFGLSGCSSCSKESPATNDTRANAALKTNAEYNAEAARGIHDSMEGDLAELLQSAKDLQAAAPVPAGRGWDAALDADAIGSMKRAWLRARVAYEHVEGVIGAMFPDIDESIDARYDDFLAKLAGKGDVDLFDKTGVTGMHAIERILYSKSTPSRAIEFEKTLPGYRPAAYPATADDASKFKAQLLQRLIDDVAIILGQWKAAPVDPGIAFHGLVLLMNEQQEKVNKAATGEEESRYADVTLFDLRHNLEGTSKCYAVFRPWVLAHGAAGQKADKAIVDGFASLEKLYGSKGDAIAQPPATWSSIHPSEADLATPFGELFRTVSRAVDADTPGTLVSEMNRVQEMLGFPAFKRR